MSVGTEPFACAWRFRRVPISGVLITGMFFDRYVPIAVFL